MNERTYLSTSAVLAAGRDLRAALVDPARPARLELATARLAGAAERSLAQLDELPAQAFEGVAGAPMPDAPAAEDVLAAALGQLGVANTLFAAGQALGERGDADAAGLDHSLHELGGTVALLGRQNQPTRQGFQALAVESSTVESAAAAFVKQVDVTLDAVVARSAQVVAGSVTGMHDGGPEKLRKAWDAVNERLKLDQLGGRLIQIGLRAFNSALDLISKVFPRAKLLTLRADVDRLIEDAGAGSPWQVLLGTVLGAPGPRRRAEQLGGRPGLALGPLDDGTSELARLAAGHDKQLDLWGGIGTAVGAARTATTFFRIAIPYLDVIILAAQLVVIGAVVTIGRDCVGRAGAIVDTAAG